MLILIRALDFHVTQIHDPVRERFEVPMSKLLGRAENDIESMTFDVANVLYGVRLAKYSFGFQVFRAKDGVIL